jgi:hypothetical protein
MPCCHLSLPPSFTRAQRKHATRPAHPGNGALMSSSNPAPGGGIEPSLAALSLADGSEDDDDLYSSLLDLLERHPELFVAQVLERVDPTARASLARVGSAFRDAVFPRSIFPFGLPPRVQTTGDAVGAVRVFKLVDFLGSAERLAWAKANGCPWGVRTCQLALGAGTWLYCSGRGSSTVGGTSGRVTPRTGRALSMLQWMRAHGCEWNEATLLPCSCGWAHGGVAVGTGARLLVGCEQMRTDRRSEPAPRGGTVGVGADRGGCHAASRLRRQLTKQTPCCWPGFTCKSK